MKKTPTIPEESTRQATRTLLLDTAERMCAAHGIEALSLRKVCEEAGANVASVSYHFGNKQKMLEALFERRIQPLNLQRLELLDVALSTPSDDLLQRIIQSFLAPVLNGFQSAESALPHGNSARVITQFLATAYSMAGEAPFLERYYEPVRSRFVMAFKICLPQLTLDEVLWRYNMMVGALIYAMAGPERMTRRPVAFTTDPSPTLNTPSIDNSLHEMTRFLVAGFRA